MSLMTQPNEAQNLSDPRGHTVGFIDTSSACETMTQALKDAGFPDAKILVFYGEEGVHLLDRMMEGSLWGESAEEALRHGTAELRVGHAVVCVEVHGSEEAAIVAEISTQHGGHSIYHFGILVDTRLTA